MFKTTLLFSIIMVWFNHENFAQSGNCYIDKDFQIKILTNYLNQLKEINNSGNWKYIQLKKNYKIGSVGKEIQSIKYNLQLLKYFPQKNENLTDTFDFELQKAIKCFQYFHHIDTSGTIGLKTIKQLNQSIENQIKDVEWNIKKWEESELSCKENFIYINISACHLKVIENQKVRLEMKVIVGRPSRTSYILNSSINEIEFYPFWVVPPGILKKDIIPQYKKDRNYLSKNNFEILTWKNEHLNLIPEPDELIKYKVQQPPGEKNPMGKVKFNFENKHYMFLHDTPGKHLFKNYPSAYSSGCIRLEKAEELALYLLDKHASLSKPEIRAFFINEKNKLIKLTTAVPLKIHYFTIWANEKEELYFADDFYKQINR
jgi:murein L,D-transpeptidase YcbB/YkuD